MQLHIDSAIIFANINGEYALVHINRFWTPERQDIISPKWMLHAGMDTPQKPFEVYDTKPTKKDLAQFEKDTLWERDIRSHRDMYELIDFGICLNNINEHLE